MSECKREIINYLKTGANSKNAMVATEVMGLGGGDGEGDGNGDGGCDGYCAF